MDNPIFLLSTGRTGTKFFSKFFDAYLIDVASYHTTKKTRFINVVGNLYARQLMPALLAGYIWKLLKYKFVKSHRSRYIENNPFYYSLSNLISAYFPGSKFIYIVRSPKTYILSHIRKENQNIKSKVANCLIPYWQPVSYIEHLKGLFGDFYQRVEFYASIWNFKNSYLLKASEENKRFITVRFEDIFDPENGPNVLKRLLDWLELLPRHCIEKSAILQKVNPSKPDKDIKWDKRCDEIVKKRCGDLMKLFHYPK